MHVCTCTELTQYASMAHLHTHCGNFDLQTVKSYGMEHAERVWKKIEAGEESEVQGLLEQWLRGGKMTESEALSLATDLFTAGVDTVRCTDSYLLTFSLVLSSIIKSSLILSCMVTCNVVLTCGLCINTLNCKQQASILGFI